jgi:hypothetical protein
MTYPGRRGSRKILLRVVSGLKKIYTMAAVYIIGESIYTFKGAIVVSL